MCSSYSPSVFLLKAGQVLHIPKGCIHAFRKLSFQPLPEDDCHFQLRKEYVQGKDFAANDICVSVAWDCICLGAPPDGMKAELEYVFDTAECIKAKKWQPFGTPEFALLRYSNWLANPRQDDGPVFSPSEVAKQLLPLLKKYLASQQSLVK